MPRISPTEFHALPLRVHTLLADVPLHDVWAVDLPKHCEGVTLREFLRRASQCESSRLPPVARALMRFRLFLGRICRLEAEPKGAWAVSFGSRLTPGDRARSFVVSGMLEGLFRVVYRFENEQLLEIQNRTVHAAALNALAERADGYRFYFAVYVRQTTWIKPFYMGLIDPFRRWIIYPALLKKFVQPGIRISDQTTHPCGNLLVTRNMGAGEFLILAGVRRPLPRNREPRHLGYGDLTGERSLE